MNIFHPSTVPYHGCEPRDTGRFGRSRMAPQGVSARVSVFRQATQSVRKIIRLCLFVPVGFPRVRTMLTLTHLSMEGDGKLVHRPSASARFTIRGVRKMSISVRRSLLRRR